MCWYLLNSSKKITSKQEFYPLIFVSINTTIAGHEYLKKIKKKCVGHKKIYSIFCCIATIGNLQENKSILTPALSEILLTSLRKKHYCKLSVLGHLQTGGPSPAVLLVEVNPLVVALHDT